MSGIYHNPGSAIIDDGDPGIIGPDEYNNDHPSDHEFVILGAIPVGLTGARQLAVTADLSLTDAGAGSTVTLGVTFPGGFTGFANPTATIGLSVVNGSATTAMRSDAAPPLSQAIVPNWTGLHTWTKPADVRMHTYISTGTGAWSWSLVIVSNSDLAFFDNIGNNYNMRLKAGGVLDIPVGFRVSNSAPSGNYLRGDGSNFISNTIQAGDLPGSFSGFANPSASIGLAVVNGSATTAMRSDAAPALSQAIAPTWTALHKWTATLGATPDDTAAGVQLLTSGTAAAAAQQISPAVHWRGSGWKTNSTAGAQFVDFREYVLPVQGAASPTAFLIWEAQINGAGYASKMYLSDIGVLNVGTGFTVGATAPLNEFLKSNGSVFTHGNILAADLPDNSANPTASVGLAAVNGIATTWMRSDAAPPLSQAIIPTWTGLHVFQKATGNYMVQFDGTGTGAKKWGIFVATTGALQLDDVTTTTIAVQFITGGIISVVTGFRIGGAAASGQYLRGNGTNFVANTIQAGDLPGSFSGFANPSASVGLAAVNGSATTAMRSDGAPPLSQAIAPTWTGIHTWSATSGAVPHTINGWAAIGSGLAPFVIKDDSNGSARIEIVGSASSSPTFQGLRSGGTIASPTRTLSAAVLSGIDGGGYDNAGTPAVHRRTGSFRAVARNDWTTSNFQTYWILSTTGANTTFSDRYYFFDDGSHMGGYMLVAASTITAPTNTTAGDLTSTRYFNLGGRIDLLGGTTNQISFGTNGVAAPGAGSAGAKIGLFASYGSMASASEYWIGIESGAMWFNSGQTFKFYFAGTNKFQMDSGAAYLFGYMNVAGSIAVPTNTTAGDFQAIRGFFTTGASFGGTHVPGFAVDVQGNERLRFNTSIGAGTYGRSLYWSDSTPTDIAAISAYDVNATNYGLHFFAWNGSSLGGPYFAVSSASVDSLIQTNVQNAYFTSYVNSQTVPTNSAGAGLAVGWNFSGGSAEVTLWNVYSSGGFTFRQRTGSSTSTLLATLDAAGNFTVPAAVTGVTGVFTTSSTSPSFFSTNLSTFTHATGNYMIEFIGTGTGAATYGLYVDTSGSFHLDWVGVAQICLWTITGDYQIFGSNAYKASGTAWINPSDARIKTVTGDFTEGLATALRFQPRRWTYNDLAPRSVRGAESLGLVAQEIEEFAPYMVQIGKGKLGTEPVDDLRAYDSHAMDFVLINAIKELNARIVQLEAAAGAP